MVFSTGLLRHILPESVPRLPRRDLHHQQFRVLLRQATMLGLANAASALLMALIIAMNGAPAAAWSWGTAVMAPTLLNAWQAWRNRHRRLPDVISRGMRRRALLWTGLIGALWGLAPILFFPGTGPELHMFITLIVVGQVAGVMVAMNALPSHYILFGATSQIPLTGALVASGTPQEIVLAVLILLFNLLMGKTVWDGYRRFLDDQIIKRELAAAQADAESASRAKSHFLAIMSHELRTPLNSIIGFAEIIQRQGYEPGDRTALSKNPTIEYAGYILDSGRHLLSLVSDILDLSRIEAGNFTLNREWVNPVDLCGTVLRSFQAEHNDLDVTLDAPPEDMESISADSRALRQIVTNLLSNACKFTEPGGAVTLKLRRTDSDLIMDVSDTGAGIPRDKQTEIFEPFRQADSDHARRHQGTGLGLPIVKRLVELHGGDIRLESQEGAGSRFRLRIPTAGPPEDVQGAPASS